MKETEDYGFDKVRSEQQELGDCVRKLMAERRFKSVTAKGYEVPGVVVCYTTDDDIQSSKKFAAVGLQMAAGVPLQCDEPNDFKAFRVGFFGLDKLHNIERTVANLAKALDAIA